MHALFGAMLPSDVSCQIMRPYIGTVTKLAVIHVFKLVFHQYLSFDILHDYLSTTFCLHLMTFLHPLGRVSKYEIRRNRHLRTVLPVLLQTETSRNEAAGHILKDFPTVDLKGNEDEILRSNC